MWNCMIVGIIILVVVVIFFTLANRSRTTRTRGEVADIIEQFLDGTGGVWDWDDFTTRPIADDELEAVRQRCSQLDEEFPSSEKNPFANPQVEQVLREYVNRLRSDIGARESEESETKSPPRRGDGL